MTKIPSVEEWKLRVEALHPTSFCNAHDIDEINWEHDKKGTIEMIEEALTAQREAGAGEERERILESLPRKFWEDADHAEGGYISKRDLKKALTPPTK